MAAPPTTAVVKSVLSGDTIVIWAKSVNGPPSEAVLGFTNVVSPRMGEPFAFEAKCFLSSIVTGNQIKYKVDSSGPSRQYCTAIIRTPIDGETNLAKIMLKAGLAKLGKSQYLYST
jgi:staphylococcal nuclease domain-containing protein 1